METLKLTKLWCWFFLQEGVSFRGVHTQKFKMWYLKLGGICQNGRISDWSLVGSGYASRPNLLQCKGLSFFPVATNLETSSWQGVCRWKGAKAKWPAFHTVVCKIRKNYTPNLRDFSSSGHSNTRTIKILLLVLGRLNKCTHTMLFGLFQVKLAWKFCNTNIMMLWKVPNFDPLNKAMPGQI